MLCRVRQNAYIGRSLSPTDVRVLEREFERSLRFVASPSYILTVIIRLVPGGSDKDAKIAQRRHWKGSEDRGRWKLRVNKELGLCLKSMAALYKLVSSTTVGLLSVVLI